MEAQVERVQHEPAARDAEVGLVVDVVVPAQRCDAVAAFEAELLQPDRERACTAAGLGVLRPVEAPVGHSA